MGGRNTSGLIATVAVVIAVAALALNVIHPGAVGATGAQGLPGSNGGQGPTGPTGPRGATGANGSTGPTGRQGGAGANGSQGPPGPGSLVVTSRTSASTVIKSTCTDYAGGNLTITVPSAGTIVVSASVWILLNHTAGARNFAEIGIGNATSGGDCIYFDSITPADVPASADTASYNYGLSPQLSFAVTAAGSYTYYISGLMPLGQNPGDFFWYANMAAVFCPA